MADTPFYHFALPSIGADQDSWGNKLNGNWTSLDTLLHNLAVGSGGSFLPLTGGTINGNLSVTGTFSVQGSSALRNTTVTGTLSVSSTLTGSTINTTNIYVGGSAAFGGYTDFAAYSNGSQRVLQFTGGTNFVFDTATSVFYWNMSGSKMSLDSGGSIQITGNGYKPGGGSWAASSDDRMKRDVSTYHAGLDKVCNLMPISFRYNGQGDTAADGQMYVGLSAQKTLPVMPELVVRMSGPGRLPGQLGTQLGPLTLALCNAVRELRDRLVALEQSHAT